MQRQELELAGDIGKHSQSQRNYEQNLSEMTPELNSVFAKESVVADQQTDFRPDDDDARHRSKKLLYWKCL